MKSYEVVAWTTADGELLCLACADKRAGTMKNPRNEHGELDGDGYFTPVFADTEFDYQPACDDCRELIEEVSWSGYEPTYNVYSLYAGAVDEELSFDDLDDAFDYFNKLKKTMMAEGIKEDSEAGGVYLYDVALGNMVEKWEV